MIAELPAFPWGEQDIEELVAPNLGIITSFQRFLEETEALVSALRGCRERHPPTELKRRGLGGLLEHCVFTLAPMLAAPEPPVDDWTIWVHNPTTLWERYPCWGRPDDDR